MLSISGSAGTVTNKAYCTFPSCKTLNKETVILSTGKKFCAIYKLFEKFQMKTPTIYSTKISISACILMPYKYAISVTKINTVQYWDFYKRGMWKGYTPSTL